jgi:Sec-independent protein translocase protein TatA
MKKLGIMMAAAMLLVGTATFASAAKPAAKAIQATKTEQTAKPKVHHKHHHKGHKKAAAPKAK